MICLGLYADSRNESLVNRHDNFTYNGTEEHSGKMLIQRADHDKSSPLLLGPALSKWQQRPSARNSSALNAFVAISFSYLPLRCNVSLTRETAENSVLSRQNKYLQEETNPDKILNP